MPKQARELSNNASQPSNSKKNPLKFIAKQQMYAKKVKKLQIKDTVPNTLKVENPYENHRFFVNNKQSESVLKLIRD